MNICDALEEGKIKQQAIRREDWPLNLAWYHGMDNQIAWWNGDPDSPCEYNTGNRVTFAIADFWKKDFELHPNVPYHGDLSL